MTVRKPARKPMPSMRVPDHVQGPLAVGPFPLEILLPEIEARVPDDFRMLLEKGGQCRIGRQIVFPLDQRRVEPDQLTDRRRIRIEDLPQLLLHVAGVLRVLVDDHGLGRSGRDGSRGDGSGPWTARNRRLLG